MPPDDPDANQLMIRQALVDRVERRPLFIPMDCEASAPEAYESVIAPRARGSISCISAWGPTATPPRCSRARPPCRLPPGAWWSTTVDPSGRNPHLRMTLTLEAIDRARLVVFTVAGADKREAMARVLGREDLPAARVRAEKVIWLCDPDATGSAGLA